MIWLNLPLFVSFKECAQETSSGQCCSIPTYNSVTYNSCTDVDQYQPWCSMTPQYSGQWGNRVVSFGFSFKLLQGIIEPTPRNFQGLCNMGMIFSNFHHSYNFFLICLSPSSQLTEYVLRCFFLATFPLDVKSNNIITRLRICSYLYQILR